MEDDDLIEPPYFTIQRLEKENKKLKEILLDVAATTHKSKKLYDWYCENSESKEKRDSL